MTTYKSNLCSCTICRRVFSRAGIHSHFLINHTEEGYLKAVAAAKKNPGKPSGIRDRNIAEYNKNPKLCINCGNPIKYDYRIHQKLCSHSCAATYSNALRAERGWKLSEESSRKIAETLTGKRRGSRLTFVKQCSYCSKWFPGRTVTCSKECHIKFMSNSAYKNNLGKQGMRSGKSLRRNDSFGKEVRLESSYEILTAELLDSLKINWLRPNPLPWTDSENKDHRYYPDFYLPSFGLYLDPKNKYLIIRDADKIERVISQNNIKVIVLPVQLLTLNNLKTLLLP